MGGCLGPAPGAGGSRMFFPFFLASTFWRPWRDGDPSARDVGWQDGWVGAWDRHLRKNNNMRFFLFFFSLADAFWKL